MIVDIPDAYWGPVTVAFAADGVRDTMQRPVLPVSSLTFLRRQSPLAELVAFKFAVTPSMMIQEG